MYRQGKYEIQISELRWQVKVKVLVAQSYPTFCAVVAAPTHPHPWHLYTPVLAVEAHTWDGRHGLTGKAHLREDGRPGGNGHMLRKVGVTHELVLSGELDEYITHTHTHTHTTEVKREAAPGSEKSVFREWHGFYRLSPKSLCSTLHHAMSIYAVRCILCSCGGGHSYVLHILCSCGGGIHLDSCVNDTPWNRETLSYFQPSPSGKNSL